MVPAPPDAAAPVASRRRSTRAGTGAHPRRSVGLPGERDRRWSEGVAASGRLSTMDPVSPERTGLPTVVGLQVGRPADHVTSAGREYSTAFWKSPVHEPRWLGRTQLDGDEQADLRVHGGADKALLAYASEHYPGWARHMGIESVPSGAFGENVTLAGLDEEKVCIGDTWRLGAAAVQVSQPRQPCW